MTGLARYGAGCLKFVTVFAQVGCFVAAPFCDAFGEARGPAIRRGVGSQATPSPERRRRQLKRLPSSRLVRPSDLVYLGAFRLPDAPDGAPEAATWEYGGQGMTYRPNGDPGGPADGFPGALLATGHDVYNRLAEIDIPVPVASPTKNLSDLNTARTLQPFRDVRGAFFSQLNELPRVGLCYLAIPQTGEKVHLAWGQHFHESEEHQTPSHAWFNPNLSAPAVAGAWWIGSQSLYSVNNYIFEIPKAWADAHVGGRYLATGRFRDGGWSGKGPSLFAYAPWLSGNPPPSGTRLVEIPLLLYSHTRADNPEASDYQLKGYQHPDEWEGGAWLTTPDGRSAVVFVGTKATGTYYWYGWINPAGPEVPCVEMAEGRMCYNADGTPCPANLLVECAGHTSDRGWWSSRSEAQIIFYNPDDLAAVAAGVLAPGQPQPYASLTIDDRLFLPDPCVESMSAGTGRQRRYRLGEAAYDRAGGRLFILERFADGAKPVVHVWQVR